MKKYHYTIFKTRRGYFGLLLTETGLYRTCLPTDSRGKTEKILTKGLKNTRKPQITKLQARSVSDGTESFQKSLLPELKNNITDYYKGIYVDFSFIKIDLSGYTPFSQKILRACMKVRYGKTMTYKQLAASAGCPNSARAVGGVMARNRLPLIIPCHRVLGSDGSLGGFSAPGGTKTKREMLDLEKQKRNT
jgi:methylated-DNA-[protein]-cysteine S-methyltransferase